MKRRPGPESHHYWSRISQPLAFAPPDRHAQAFHTPAPLDGLAVDHPSLLAQDGVARR
jgi:hypothetical protein